MKKFILAIFLLIGGLVGVNQVSAQRDSIDRGHERQDRMHRHQVYRDDRRYDDYNQGNQRLVTTREYQYIRMGRTLYRETYVTTYTRRGILVNRVLVDRSRVSERDRGRRGLNIFFRLFN